MLSAEKLHFPSQLPIQLLRGCASKTPAPSNIFGGVLSKPLAGTVYSYTTPKTHTHKYCFKVEAQEAQENLPPKHFNQSLQKNLSCYTPHPLYIHTKPTETEQITSLFLLKAYLRR